MKKVAIITDSIANLLPLTVEQYGIQIMPVNISFNGKTYRDSVDLTAAEAYRMLAEKPGQFFASPASLGEYIKIFKQTAIESESIFCITLSSRLSGMHNMAVLAVKQLQEEKCGTRIEVMDSRNATAGEGLIVTAACRCAEKGGTLDDVLNVAQTVRQRVAVIGVLETIKYVYRTGRIPRVASKFGSMLNIRPVFAITDGSVHVTGVTRNQESGIKRIIRQMKAGAGNGQLHVAIAHADVPEAGEKLKGLIQQEFSPVELWLTDFSPVMGYATGTGVLAAGYYTDNESTSN